MPKVQYTEVEHHANVDTTVDVYDHEVLTTVDLSDLEGDVLKAISFENAHDLLIWANDEKNISFDDIHICLTENDLGTPLAGKRLAEYSLAELFEEMLRRHIGQVI